MFLNQVNVLDKIEVPFSTSKVLAYLWKIQNLERYEPKVDSAEIFPKSEEEGTYIAQGRFAGLPWRGQFSYRKNKNGFLSKMLTHPYGVSVQGGFEVIEKGRKRSQLIHFENYKFPLWFAPLTLLIKTYLKWTIRRELLNIQKDMKSF